jgi:DNA adenine methylase
MTKTTPSPQPFAKWLGGKRRLLSRILPRMVPIAEPGVRYVEPFVGGGAVFFALRAAGFTGPALLNDLCAPLVNTYRQVRDRPQALHAAFRELADSNSREAYYEARKAPPVPYGLGADVLPEEDPVALAWAAWFLYINRAGFNGLWRENKAGKLNTPYGDGKPITAPSWEVLLAASQALQGVEIRHGSFEGVEVGPGDVVYADPPYLPLTRTASFVAYTRAGFGGVDQLRLASWCKVGARKGAHIVLSNAGHVDSVACFASRASLVEDFDAPRSISCKGDERDPVKEYLFTFEPEK